MLQNLCITHVMLLPASDVQRSEHKQLQLRLIVPVQCTGLLAAAHHLAAGAVCHTDFNMTIIDDSDLLHRDESALSHTRVMCKT